MRKVLWLLLFVSPLTFGFILTWDDESDHLLFAHDVSVRQMTDAGSDGLVYGITGEILNGFRSRHL